MELNVEYLPKGINDPLFEQRESGRAHTPYEMEVEFYSCIKRGDVSGVEKLLNAFIQNTLVVGRMSDDNLRQTQYFAVSCITLAVRYAIEGGLEQSVAYNLSDKYIMCVDRMDTKDQIVAFLADKAVELAKAVCEHKRRSSYPSHVKKAIKYIDAHLHEKLTVADIANECAVSADYLSSQFKKCTNDTLSHYILRKKLEASKSLLLNSDACEYSEVGYYFGFCSQTYYISCFKKEFGMTPKQFKNLRTY